MIALRTSVAAMHSPSPVLDDASVLVSLELLLRASPSLDELPSPVVVVVATTPVAESTASPTAAPAHADARATKTLAPRDRFVRIAPPDCRGPAADHGVCSAAISTASSDLRAGTLRSPADRWANCTALAQFDQQLRASRSLLGDRSLLRNLRQAIAIAVVAIVVITTT
jgi:hypothetical protein